MSEATDEPLITTGQDAAGDPFIAWQQPDGRYYRVWIEHVRRDAWARFLLVASTKTLGGEPLGKPGRSQIFNDADDWDILRDYVKHAISPPPG